MTSESILDQLGRLFLPFGNCSWNVLNNIAIKDAQFILALVYRNPVIDSYLHLVCRHLPIYRLTDRTCLNKATKLIVQLYKQPL